MSSRKKRNKKYRGRDATKTPGVIKVSAPNRSAFRQWLYDNKQTVIIRAVQIIMVSLIGSTIYWIFW